MILENEQDDTYKYKYGNVYLVCNLEIQLLLEILK